MPEELENFKVWRPPPPPDDEPLVEDNWRDDGFQWLRRGSRRLTATGYLWLVVPGYLFMAKDLSISGSEFLIFIGAWTMSFVGLAIPAISAHLRWPFLVVGGAILAHLHSVMFSGSVYRARFFPEESDEQRVFNVLIMQLVVVIPVWVVVGLRALGP